MSSALATRLSGASHEVNVQKQLIAVIYQAGYVTHMTLWTESTCW